MTCRDFTNFLILAKFDIKNSSNQGVDYVVQLKNAFSIVNSANMKNSSNHSMSFVLLTQSIAFRLPDVCESIQFPISHLEAENPVGLVS